MSRGPLSQTGAAFCFSQLLHSLNLPPSVVLIPEDHCQFSTLSGGALEINQAWYWLPKSPNLSRRWKGLTKSQAHLHYQGVTNNKELDSYFGSATKGLDDEGFIYPQSFTCSYCTCMTHFLCVRQKSINSDLQKSWILICIIGISDHCAFNIWWLMWYLIYWKNWPVKS